MTATLGSDLDFGLARLLEQCLEDLGRRFWEIDYHFPESGSPIEDLFAAALTTYVWHGPVKRHSHILFAKDDEEQRAFMNRSSNAVKNSTIVVRQQYQLPNWRVDFFISAFRWHALEPSGKWETLIVECDGHDFHERTRDQASRDRSRDREAQMLGLTVFRFTGAEIVNNPWGCAKQVCEWTDRGG